MQTNSDIWVYLSRTDVIFGVLGGFGSIWSFVFALRQHLVKSTSTQSVKPRHLASSKAGVVSSLFLHAVSAAADPISLIMIISALLGLGTIIALEADATLIIIAAAFIIFTAIFVGLCVGTTIDMLTNSSGLAIHDSVILAVGFAFVAFLVSGTGNASQWFSLTFVAGIIGSLVGAVLGLARDRSEETSKLHPDGSWERASEIAIERFKKQNEKFGWFREKINTEKYRWGKGRGYLQIAVVEYKNSGLWGQAQWYPHERYKLTIDRTGDILEIEALPVSEDEKYKNPLREYHKFQDADMNSMLEFLQRSEAKDEIYLESIKEPRAIITSSGLTVEIEFVVMNLGKAATIYPMIEIHVAELKSGSYVSRVVQKTIKVDLKSNSRMPISYLFSLDPTTQLISRSAKDVKVILQQKPNQ